MTSSPNQRIPFYWISGVGADGRFFAPLFEPDDWATQLGYQLIAVDWLAIEKGERMEEYGRRLARSVGHSAGEACVVAGLSFGGMLAPYSADELGAEQCFLFATVRQGKEMPWFYRRLRWILRCTGSGIWNAAQAVIRERLKHFTGNLSPNRKSVYEQFIDIPPNNIHRSLEMILYWSQPTPQFNFPIHQLHAKNDRLLPVRFTTPDVILESGGHGLTLTRPDEVKEFLTERLITQ